MKNDFESVNDAGLLCITHNLYNIHTFLAITAGNEKNFTFIVFSSCCDRIKVIQHPWKALSWKVMTQRCFETSSCDTYVSAKIM